MKIGLIDVDGHNYPNLPLMKLATWHKKQGNSVEWYKQLFHNQLNASAFDMVYLSKVFTFTSDYIYKKHINTKKLIEGGTGYFYPDGGEKLTKEIENTYPDYDLYHIKNTAYGFLTRGCPKNCKFCIVTKKEGCQSKKVANLDYFFNGQKNIELLDPNILACKDWKELFWQLIDSRAYINFSQGLDIRLINQEKIEMLQKMKIKSLHFAWDNYDEKEMIVSKLKEIKEETKWNYKKLTIYVLTNYGTTIQQDLERIYTLREIGCTPYIMIYEKEKLPFRHELKKLQRWVNSKKLFHTIEKFENYIG